jgi:elongation factor 1 alpha-like protein
VTLLDAPGHADFVPNMITGATQADAALLVVDGSPGKFEAGFKGVAAKGATTQPPGSSSKPPSGGQTREHIQVARSVGVQQLAVAVTKLDLCGYDETRFEEVKAQLGPFLAACGYKEPQWLPVDAPSGQNVTAAPIDERLARWWPEGSTLLDAIDRFVPVERSTGMPLFPLPALAIEHSNVVALQEHLPTMPIAVFLVVQTLLHVSC